MKIIINIVLLLCLCSAAGLALLYFFQNKLIYPAPKSSGLLQLPGNASKLTLGDTYAYLLLPPHRERGAQLPLLIYTHGNGELADYWLGEFDYFLAHKFAVLLVEYPGYGAARGNASLYSIQQTLLNAYDTAASLEFIDENAIIAYGRSIGGGAAALLAKQRPLAALGLESSFSSLPKLVSEMGFPSFLVKDRYDNESIVGALEIPVFLYHGTEDIQIPISHSYALKRAAKNATLHTEKCGHNNCPAKWQEFVLFLREETSLKF